MHDLKVADDSEGFRLVARSLLTHGVKVCGTARAAEIAFCAAARAIRQRSSLLTTASPGRPRRASAGSRRRGIWRHPLLDASASL